MSKYKRGHQQSVDGNELEIIKALEDKGCFVVSGMDDLNVYDFTYNCLSQLEVKSARLKFLNENLLQLRVARLYWKSYSVEQGHAKYL